MISILDTADSPLGAFGRKTHFSSQVHFYYITCQPFLEFTSPSRKHSFPHRFNLYSNLTSHHISFHLPPSILQIYLLEHVFAEVRKEYLYSTFSKKTYKFSYCYGPAMWCHSLHAAWTSNSRASNKFVSCSSHHTCSHFQAIHPHYNPSIRTENPVFLGSSSWEIAKD